MPYYDAPNAFYDAPNVFYDKVSVTPNRRKPMAARIRLTLSRLNAVETEETARSLALGFTNNVADFATPTPAVAAVLADVDELQALIAEANSADQIARAKRAARDQKADAVKVHLGNWVRYAELTTDDPIKLGNVGFDLRAEPQPSGPMPQVQALALTAGDIDGELDAQWDPVPNARSYEVQVSPDPVTPTSWVSEPTATRSKTTIGGLTSGAKMWVRVRAIGAQGPGNYSDVAAKIVP